MEVTPQDLDKSERITTTLKELMFEAGFIKITQRRLLELYKELTVHLATMEISDVRFAFWQNKADEYYVQSIGLSALLDLRSTKIQVLREEVVALGGKYGVEGDADNSKLINSSKE